LRKAEALIGVNRTADLALRSDARANLDCHLISPAGPRRPEFAGHCRGTDLQEAARDTGSRVLRLQNSLKTGKITANFDYHGVFVFSYMILLFNLIVFHIFLDNLKTGNFDVGTGNFYHFEVHTI
jgi:hypothetical protein